LSHFDVESEKIEQNPNDNNDASVETNNRNSNPSQDNERDIEREPATELTKGNEHFVDSINKKKTQRSVTLNVLKRLPWKIVPFVIGVFIIVQVKFPI
jgi:hypothetical protein